MRIKWKGQDLGEWRGSPSLRESRKIKAELEMLPPEFMDAISKMDPDATCMLVAFMLTRSGTPTNYEDVDGDYEDLEIVLDEAAPEEGKAPASGSGDEKPSEPSSSDTETGSETSTQP